MRVSSFSSSTTEDRALGIKTLTIEENGKVVFMFRMSVQDGIGKFELYKGELVGVDQ